MNDEKKLGPSSLTEAKKRPRPSFWPALVFGIVNLAAWWAALRLSVRVISPLQMRLLHVAVFISWTLAFSAVWRNCLRLPRNFKFELGTAFLAAAAAAALEFFLKAYGHNISWHGFATNILGVALAGSIIWLLDKRGGPDRA